MTGTAIRELGVRGVFHVVPPQLTDERGLLAAVLLEDELLASTGRGMFPVRQFLHSRSRRGAARGIHVTAGPGMAKYVHCARGRVLDVVVDLRVGSPTFGVSASVVLDGHRPASVLVPIGVGHALVALEDDTVVHYALSAGYDGALERGVALRDPALAVSLPPGLDLVLSARDAAAPTLAEAARSGLLPDYATCRERDDELCGVRAGAAVCGDDGGVR